MTRLFFFSEDVSERRKLRHCGAAMSHGSESRQIKHGLSVHALSLSQTVRTLNLFVIVGLLQWIDVLRVPEADSITSRFRFYWDSSKTEASWQCVKANQFTRPVLARLTEASPRRCLLPPVEQSASSHPSTHRSASATAMTGQVPSHDSLFDGHVALVVASSFGLAPRLHMLISVFISTNLFSKSPSDESTPQG